MHTVFFDCVHVLASYLHSIANEKLDNKKTTCGSSKALYFDSWKQWRNIFYYCKMHFTNVSHSMT